MLGNELGNSLWRFLVIQFTVNHSVAVGLDSGSWRHVTSQPCNDIKNRQSLSNEKWNAFKNLRQVILPVISPLEVRKLFWCHTRISQWGTAAAKILQLDQSFIFQQAYHQWISSYHSIIAIDKNTFFMQFRIECVQRMHICETELLPCFYMLGFRLLYYNWVNHNDFSPLVWLILPIFVLVLSVKNSFFAFSLISEYTLPQIIVDKCYL